MIVVARRRPLTRRGGVADGAKSGQGRRIWHLRHGNRPHDLPEHGQNRQQPQVSPAMGEAKARHTDNLSRNELRSN